MGDFFNRNQGRLILTDLEVDSPTFVIDETNNRVGIGTLVPAKTLHIKGGGTQRVFIESTDNQAGIELKSDSTNGAIIYSPNASDDLNFYVGGSDRVVFNSGGEIRLKTEIATPTTPDSGAGGALYIKSDGKLYYLSDDVAETDLTAGGGGAATNDVDALLHHQVFS